MIKLKKKVKSILLILIFITIIIKMLQIIEIALIKGSIDEFENFKNSLYEVKIVKDNDKKIKIIRRIKDNKFLEYNEFSAENMILWKYIDIDSKEGIIAHYNFKIKNSYEYENTNYKGLRNLPEITRNATYIYDSFKNGNILPVFYCFKILYIIPKNYNGIPCYKIKTTKEVLYVERKTLYPVHLEYYEKNSSDKNQKVEIEYVFKTDCVTDEEMEIPDIENYTWMDTPYLEEQVDKE